MVGLVSWMSNMRMREGQWDGVMDEWAGDMRMRGHHVIHELMGNRIRLLSGHGVDTDHVATPTFHTHIWQVF